MTQQQAIVFSNRNGLNLFGVWHAPTAPGRRDVAVILLSPGVKMRVGPEGLYRRMAERFVAMGIPVFRFDFFGLGDSEGELPEELLRDVYNHIEMGRFVDDTVDAMSWVERQHSIRGFILAGLCGGAITGLLAASKDSRVAGLLGLGMTPVVASRAADSHLYMTAGQLDEKRRKYFRRLLVPQAWFRLLTLQSDFGVMWRFMTLPLKRLRFRAKHQPALPSPERDDANPLFPPAFFKVVGGGTPTLLIFGGSDRLRWEFEEKFVARYSERLRGLQGHFDVHVIPQANHVLSLPAWQQEMLDVSSRWIARHFAPRAARAPALREGRR